jgi:outer membrane protein OmpA-like peptidoglycan-associated protein
LHLADQETIHGVAAMMARDPALVATVLGKADTVGNASYNERLSQRRAEPVSEALIHGYKVPANRVEMRWTGET